MAEIVDQLRLDIDAALRDVNRIEQALDRALAPVEVRVDATQAQRQLDDLARSADQIDVRVDVDDRELAELESTLAEVQRIADRAATETQSIALAAGRAEVNFEDLARAMGITEREAQDLTTELLQSQAAANRLEDSARDVARQLGLSDAEADRLTRSLRTADRAADDINVTATRTVGAFGSLRTAAAGIASAFAVIGGAQLFGAAFRGAQAAITQFAALNESINAVQVTFGDASEAVFEFGERSAQSAGLSAQAFQQAVVPIGAVLTNFGFAAREAADASIQLVQRAADLASVFNTDVNEALLAINSALVGQVEPLRRYGAEISQARVQAFALATGLLQAGQEMDTATAIQARFGLILQDTNRVAGDFANTSDEYANASRIAAAEVEKLQATIGEALLPAFEAILTQAPAIIAFFDSLVPQLAATAEGAAAAGAGLAEFVSGATLGLGEFGDLAGSALDILQGFPAIVADTADAFIDWDLSFNRTNAQIDQFTQRRANTLIRVASQSIPAAVARGDDAITAFANAIAFLGRQEDGLNTIQQAFERLTRVAGLTDEEARLVTQTLLDQADALGFTAAEVRFLTDRLEEFRNNLTPIGLEVEQAARAMADFDEPLRTVGTRFTVFTGELAQIPIEMQTVAVRMRTAAAAIGEALNPFDEAAAEIEVSAREFFQNLTDQINREAQFQAGLVELILREQFNLAEALGAQGPAAQQALEEFLADVNLAEAAEAALSGQGTELSLLIEDTLTKAIADASTPEIRQALIELLGLFTNTQVRDAIVTGSASAATRGISEFRTTLLSGADQLIPEVGDRLENLISQFWPQEDAAELAGEKTEQSFIDGVEQGLDRDLQAVFADVGIDLDLFDDGVESRLTFFAGLSTPQPGEVSNLRSSITATIDSAIFRDSPPKLFLDIGKESGDAFWSGFNQSELTLRTAVPSITGRIATTASSAAVGLTGPLVELTLNNPTVQDAVSDTARLAQIANSVAQTYNSVRPV